MNASVMDIELQTMQVSVREARMAVDRVLLTCGIAKGYIHAVSGCVLLSQSLALGGFEALLHDYQALRAPRLDSIRVIEHADGSIDIDGAGLHAWLVLPSVVDLAVASARRNGSCRARVVNVVAPQELNVACALARRYGAAAEVSTTETHTFLSVRNAERPRAFAQWDPLLHAAINSGYPCPRAMWRDVYALSNTALAPDTVQSRRHAGPVIVDEQGRLVGRAPIDDETDLSTLTT